jgi:hypothetical protein
MESGWVRHRDGQSEQMMQWLVCLSKSCGTGQEKEIYRGGSGLDSGGASCATEPVRLYLCSHGIGLITDPVDFETVQ